MTSSPLRQQLIKAVRLFDRQAPHPTLDHFLQQTTFSRRQIQAEFGSWSSLRQAAALGPPPLPLNRFTDDQLLQSLADLSETLKRFPTQKEINLLSGFSFHTYHRRFGPSSQLVEALQRFLDRQRRDDSHRDKPDQSVHAPETLRRLWQKLNIACILLSSDLTSQPQFKTPDIAICLAIDKKVSGTHTIPLHYFYSQSSAP